MTPAGYQKVASLFAERTGFALGPARCEDVRAASDRLMKGTGVRDEAAFLAKLCGDPRLFDALVAALVVGETYFLRTPEHFDFVRREVLPSLAAQRPPSHTLRAWSAGCASGEEVYSLAIVLEEEGWGDRMRLLGTDISRVALAQARDGSYASWSMRGTPPSMVDRYFKRTGDRFVLAPRVRRHITFEVLNLASDGYPSFASGTWGLDLVFCRNVLIYFTNEIAARVTRRLVSCLHEGGWLVLGPSDPPLPANDPHVDAVQTASGVYYRRKGGGIENRQEPPRASALVALAARASAPETPEKPETRPAEPAIAPADPLAPARAAFDAGDYDRVIALTALVATAAASALRVRAIANSGEPAAAVAACEEALRAEALSPELHLLHAALLMEIGRDEAAARAARKALYLDASLAVGHFLLGTILRRTGDARGAIRAYRNAYTLATSLNHEVRLPLADGQKAGGLAEAARVQLDLLEGGAMGLREEAR